MKKQPKISLVGAGPGDPDLITIKAAKAIANADAVLYDALVDQSLLDLAPARAVRLFVGKRAGKKAFTQEEINLQLVQHAFTYGHVVRLKGGDPFVFGRGYEELKYIQAFNIEATVIPGISSAIAVPELQGVPVTSRGYSEGFWVMTGTTKTGQLSNDIQLAVHSTATIIILMGIKKLPEIADIFCRNNRADLPVMVVQNGSKKNEKAVIGTMEDIVAKAAAHKIGTPGIIVAGKTVELHDSFIQDYVKTQFNQSPLDNTSANLFSFSSSTNKQ